MMYTDESNSSRDKLKPLHSTLNTTPKKSLFTTPLKSYYKSEKRNQADIKQPIPFFNLTSKTTRNKHRQLLQLNVDAFNGHEPSANKSIETELRTLSSFDKTKAVLPVLTKASALNNFIAKGYKPSEETKEYIELTMYNYLYNH